ncbi:SIMPL domain-containing protein [Microbulbifer sp. 2205BS26-8]|uniref:SIMPL domain-containing protein n=1 Tax=Microbulbifer sp. 2205BS26-8 TaxID=3064386 RepID=UPI00273E6A10|nr:SIMPL domain-containing protein [Microbulbifer sp. 2205BS26-8]MDP5209760.1 SIMPL domain-containing protein [Microbulbifer sp. 2205BS26-8]
MKLIPLSTITLLALLVTACGSGSAPAERGTLVTIAAHGEVSQAPDIASISVGVVTEAGDSKKAMGDNAEQMEALMAAIKKAGIAKKDIQTSGISLWPRYQYQQNRKPQLVGYTARNTVSIKVRKLDELGDLLDDLADAGANQVNGPSFEIGEPAPVQAKAREKALLDAQERATIYAKALGMKVRRIVSISEKGTGDLPHPVMLSRNQMTAEKDRATTPVAPGEITVTVNLDLVFELQD